MPLSVLLKTSALPRLKIPPPWLSAVLSLIVLLVIREINLVSIPPPITAELPLTVVSVRVTPPRQWMPPPDPPVFPSTTLPSRNSEDPRSI